MHKSSGELTVAIGGLTNWGARVLAGAAVAVTATTGYAADLSYKDTPVAGDKFEWTANIGGTSDYIFRGISQNRRDPALQGGVDVTYGMFYAGAWASGVNFDTENPPANKLGSHVEVDLYGGIKPKYGDITFDFGVISYNYPNTNVDHVNLLYDPAYVELKAGASKTVLTDVSISGTLFYSPDYGGELGSAVTLEGTISKPIYKFNDFEFAVSGTLGHVFFSEDKGPDNATALADYTYGNLGLTTTFKTAYSLDLRWWDSDISHWKLPGGVNGTVLQTGSAFAATAKVTF
jgi:uncharacterized protein (TIGR02001 family)